MQERLKACEVSHIYTSVSTTRTVVYPRFRMIPMGWTHALDLAQNFFAHLVSGLPGTP